MEMIYSRRLLVDVNVPGQTHPSHHPEMVSQWMAMDQCVQDDCHFRVGVLKLLSCQSPSGCSFWRTDNLLAWRIYVGNENALPLKTKQGKRTRFRKAPFSFDRAVILPQILVLALPLHLSAIVLRVWGK